MFAALGSGGVPSNMAKGRGFEYRLDGCRGWRRLRWYGGLGAGVFPCPGAGGAAGAVWSVRCGSRRADGGVSFDEIRSETGTWLKAAVSLLALLAVWDVFAGAWPELMQFSLSAWHEAELWILLGAGALMMAGRKGPVRFPAAWWLLGAGVCGVLLAYAVGVVAAVDVQAFPEARRAELMSGWGLGGPASMPLPWPCAWREAFACGVRRMPGTRRWKLRFRSVFFFHCRRCGCSVAGYGGGCPVAALRRTDWRSGGPSRMRKAPGFMPLRGAPCATPRSSGVPCPGRTADGDRPRHGPGFPLPGQRAGRHGCRIQRGGRSAGGRGGGRAGFEQCGGIRRRQAGI